LGSHWPSGAQIGDRPKSLPVLPGESIVTSDQLVPEKTYLIRALEISIHIGLFALLAVSCLLILSPFILVIVWGLIISIAGYPGYCKLQKLL
jgi:hypothetical protein